MSMAKRLTNTEVNRSNLLQLHKPIFRKLIKQGYSLSYQQRTTFTIQSLVGASVNLCLYTL